LRVSGARGSMAMAGGSFSASGPRFYHDARAWTERLDVALLHIAQGLEGRAEDAIRMESVVSAVHLLVADRLPDGVD
jgi:hypothetical protein